MAIELTNHCPFTETIASSTPKLTTEEAIAKAEATLKGKYNDFPVALEYFAKPDGTAVLAHVVQIQNDATDAWVEAFIDAHTGELVSIVDFVAHASVSHCVCLSNTHAEMSFAVPCSPHQQGGPLRRS